MNLLDLGFENYHTHTHTKGLKDKRNFNMNTPKELIKNSHGSKSF